MLSNLKPLPRAIVILVIVGAIVGAGLAAKPVLQTYLKSSHPADASQASVPTGNVAPAAPAAAPPSPPAIQSADPADAAVTQSPPPARDSALDKMKSMDSLSSK